MSSLINSIIEFPLSPAIAYGGVAITAAGFSGYHIAKKNNITAAFNALNASLFGFSAAMAFMTAGDKESKKIEKPVMIAPSIEGRDCEKAKCSPPEFMQDKDFHPNDMPFYLKLNKA